MSQFSALVSNSRNLTPAQRTKNFIGSRLNPGDTFTPKAATITGNIALGGTSITLGAALDVDLYEGTPIFVKASWTGITDLSDVYAAEYVIVSEFVAAGDTTVPIEPSLVAITSPLARIPAWTPFFSTKNITVSSSGNIISDNVFSGGLEMEKAQTSTDKTANTSGPTVYGDPGLEEFRLAHDAGQKVVVCTVKPDQRGGSIFVAYVSQFDEAAEKDAFYQSTVNLAVTGGVYKLGELADSGL
jgi:hypothetical protein